MFRRLSRLKLGPELSNAGVVGAEKEGEAAENTKGRKKEEPIRRMKRRLGLWKECRRTSAGGQPRAIPLSLSLASRTLLPPPPSGGNREYSITPSPSSPLSSMAASSSILQLIPLSAHIPLGHVRVHAIVVVTDTSRGLTCHTRSAVHLPSTADRPPTTPLLHPSFGPPGCIGTPAAIAVGRHR